MTEVEETVELKFRIYDGTDVGHSTYASSMTVATLKQKLIAEWPQGLSSFVVYLSLDFIDLTLNILKVG